MASPAPKSPELSDKGKKYDRQIRLWGEHGQKLLENAKICLINATALGTEILKGVVLPGIGGFTIIDDAVCIEEDVGCNFFVETSSIGCSRAKCAAQYLQELNPDVNGDYVDETVDTLLQNSPDFFKNFNVVIANAISEKSIAALSNKLWDLNIPFILCRSIGFIATARLQIKEHCIIETHPDNRQYDLRLENPFPALQETFDKCKLSTKTPWLLVLHKFVTEWSLANGLKMPQTFKEKTEVRNLIRKNMTADEENYEEAVKAVNYSFGGGRASTGTRKILDDQSCSNPNKQSDSFWILARAVKEFEETGDKKLLPLPGIIPDMTSDTASYINLQNIYRSQAFHDADIVYRRAQEILKELDRPRDSISETDARLFCREVGTLGLVRTSKIADEYDRSYRATHIGVGLETPQSLMGHYVALRAMERFQSEYGCIPGDQQVSTDTVRLKTEAGKLLSEWGITSNQTDDLLHELCRYGGAEIHSISAFMGGCVAQEIIKLITKQYKPINNTLIYDGIRSETETFEF